MIYSFMIYLRLTVLTADTFIRHYVSEKNYH